MPVVTPHGGWRAVRCTPNTKHLFKMGWVALLHQGWSCASGFIFKCVTLVKAISVFLHLWVLFGGDFSSVFFHSGSSSFSLLLLSEGGEPLTLPVGTHIFSHADFQTVPPENKKSSAHQIPQQKGCCSQGLNRKWDQGSISYLKDLLIPSLRTSGLKYFPPYNDVTAYWDAPH